MCFKIPSQQSQMTGKVEPWTTVIAGSGTDLM